MAVLSAGMAVSCNDIRYLFSRPRRLVRTILAMNVLGPIVVIADPLLRRELVDTPEPAELQGTDLRQTRHPSASQFSIRRPKGCLIAAVGRLRLTAR